MRKRSMLGKTALPGTAVLVAALLAVSATSALAAGKVVTIKVNCRPDYYLTAEAGLPSINGTVQEFANCGSQSDVISYFSVGQAASSSQTSGPEDTGLRGNVDAAAQSGARQYVAFDGGALDSAYLAERKNSSSSFGTPIQLSDQKYSVVYALAASGGNWAAIVGGFHGNSAETVSSFYKPREIAPKYGFTYAISMPTSTSVVLATDAGKYPSQGQAYRPHVTQLRYASGKWSTRVFKASTDTASTTHGGSTYLAYENMKEGDIHVERVDRNGNLQNAAPNRGPVNGIVPDAAPGISVTSSHIFVCWSVPNRDGFYCMHSQTLSPSSKWSKVTRTYASFKDPYLVYFQQLGSVAQFTFRTNSSYVARVG